MLLDSTTLRPRLRTRAAVGFAVVCVVVSAAVFAMQPETRAATHDRSAFLLDATPTHVPAAPELHALDAAFLDVDRDGDLDVAIAVEGDVNRLYLNDGHGHLTWKPGAFGTVAHDSEHVRSADFNGDGLPDLVFVAEDDHIHQLFFSRGDGTFIDASANLPARSQANGLAVGDVNGDGLADIVVGNSKETRAGQPAISGQDFLWLNDPKAPGRFIDATRTHMPRDDDGTQGVALADLDADGDLDMILANETPPSRLLLNDGKGHFTDASERLELVTPMETREVHVFDATGDGKPDVLFFNLTSNAQQWDKDPQLRLLVNDGGGRFKDQTATRLPKNTFSSWGGAVVDINHDGQPDILVGAIQVPGFVPLQARAYLNDGKGHFEDRTARVMPATMVGRHWSTAVGDLDGDRIDDVFIGGWGTQARLLLGRSGKVSSQTD